MELFIHTLEEDFSTWIISADCARRNGIKFDPDNTPPLDGKLDSFEKEPEVYGDEITIDFL